MKIKSTLLAIAASTLLVSCATQNKGPAWGHEHEFRKQLADSMPVKDWGYKIQDIRFSGDYHRALVIFSVPGQTTAQEVVLEDDGFGRYKGTLLRGDVTAAANARPSDYTVRITVSLPRK